MCILAYPLTPRCVKSTPLHCFLDMMRLCWQHNCFQEPHFNRGVDRQKLPLARGSLGALLLVGIQVAEATNFLARMHPLKHVAPVRKSQVQHAISEMLTAILKRLVLERPLR